MATHNIQDGTGGLDASIQFLEEQKRPEVGREFPTTSQQRSSDVSSHRIQEVAFRTQWTNFQELWIDIPHVGHRFYINSCIS